MKINPFIVWLLESELSRHDKIDYLIHFLSRNWPNNIDKWKFSWNLTYFWLINQITFNKNWDLNCHHCSITGIRFKSDHNWKTMISDFESDCPIWLERLNSPKLRLQQVLRRGLDVMDLTIVLSCDTCGGAYNKYSGKPKSELVWILDVQLLFGLKQYISNRTSEIPTGLFSLA